MANQQVPSGVTLCSMAGCAEPAVSGYTWDWGESGMCCLKHQFELAQKAPQLKRRVQFHALADAPAPSLTRDERARLKGETFALEEEVKDLKARAADLYRQNTLLTQQLQAMMTRHRELTAQLQDALAEREQAGAAAQRAQAAQADMVDELTRLRALVSPPSPPQLPDTHEAGQGSGTGP